jgi:putative FmdB family regulatory protein
MPIYEYHCEACGQQVELLVRSRTGAPPTCPNCGSTRLERRLSVPHLITSERRSPGRTCCGREERCDSPPCSGDQACRREA